MSGASHFALAMRAVKVTQIGEVIRERKQALRCFLIAGPYMSR
jgi:hypothetical protein